MRGIFVPLVGGLVAVAFAAAAGTAPAQVRPPEPGTPAIPGGVPTPQPGAPSPVGLPSFTPAPNLTPPPSAGSATASPEASAPAAGPSTAAPGAGAPIVRFSGQLLDVRNGFAFFTTGDAFRVGTPLKIVDLDTGGPTTLVPGPRIYARATMEKATGSIVELALTKKHLAQDAAYQQAYAVAHAFAAPGSSPIPAPELLHQVRVTGRAVAVTFYVQVPPTTPLTDDVFITTDASGWVPNAMKMDRIDALHYRLTRTYASGTKFAYRYTRGSWNSVEVGEDGLQDDPHQFFVPEVDAKRLTDTVFRWSDQNPAQQQVGPDSIPTPFNPNPFGGLPSTLRQGIPLPSPTPKP
jgi:hypothetical protein